MTPPPLFSHFSTHCLTDQAKKVIDGHLPLFSLSSCSRTSENHGQFDRSVDRSIDSTLPINEPTNHAMPSNHLYQHTRGHGAATNALMEHFFLASIIIIIISGRLKVRLRHLRDLPKPTGMLPISATSQQRKYGSNSSAAINSSKVWQHMACGC